VQQTVSELMANVSAAFPRTQTLGWQNYFNTNLEAWLYELCDFPFWFLVQSPSPAFWSNFPLTQDQYPAIPLQMGQWALSGWLILEPGVTQYSMAAPFEDENESVSAWWSIYRAASIDTARLHDDNGMQLCQLFNIPANEFVNRYQFGWGNNGNGPPQYCTLKTTESGSSIVVWPKPDRFYPLAVTWTMRESPPYISPTPPGNTYAKFLNWSPPAVYYKAMLQTASFFNELEMKKEFAEQLYGKLGAPKSDFSAMTDVGGIIGALKEETYRKNSSRQQQAAYYKSSAQATGKRNPNGWGAIPYGYGYRL
jgi:hypothetical protein